MKTSLTQGMDTEAAQDVRAAFLSCLPFRKQLTKMLNNRISVTRKDMANAKKFSDADWALQMAHSMGYEQAQYEFIALLNEDKLK